MDSERTRNLKDLRQKRLQYFDKISQPRPQSANTLSHKPSSPKHKSITLANRGLHNNTHQRSNQSHSSSSREHGSILAWGSEERLAPPQQNKRLSDPGLPATFKSQTHGGIQLKTGVDRRDVNSESYLSPLRRSLNQAKSQANGFNTTRLQNGSVNQAQRQAKTSNTTRVPNGKGDLVNQAQQSQTKLNSNSTRLHNGHHGDEILSQDSYRYSFENFKQVNKERFYSTKPLENAMGISRNTSSGVRHSSADSSKHARDQVLNSSTVSTVDASYDAFRSENMLQEMGHVQKLRSKVHDELKINFYGEGHGWTTSHHKSSRDSIKSSSSKNSSTMVTDENHNIQEEHEMDMRYKSKEKTMSAKENKDPIHLTGVTSRMQDGLQKETKFVEDHTDADAMEDEFNLGALQEAAKQGDDVLRRYIKRLTHKLHEGSNSDNETNGSEDGGRDVIHQDWKESDHNSDDVTSSNDVGRDGAHQDGIEKDDPSNEFMPEGNNNEDVDLQSLGILNESKEYSKEEVEDVGCLSTDEDLTSDENIKGTYRHKDANSGGEDGMTHGSNPQEAVAPGLISTSRSDGAIMTTGANNYQPSIAQPAITSNQLQELGLFEDMFSSSQTDESRSVAMKQEDPSDSSMDEDRVSSTCLENKAEEKDLKESIEDLQLATHRPEDRSFSPLKNVQTTICGSDLDTSASKWEFPYIHIPSNSVLRAEVTHDTNMLSDGSDAGGETDMKNLQPKPPGGVKKLNSKKNVHAAKHLMRSSNSNGLSRPSSAKRPKTPERHIVGVREHHEKDRETRRPGSAKSKPRESSSPSRSARLDERRSDESGRVSVLNSSFQRGVSPEPRVKPVSISSLDLHDITDTSRTDNQGNGDMSPVGDISENPEWHQEQENVEDELQLMQKIADFEPQASSASHSVGAGGDAPVPTDKNWKQQVSFELPHQDAIDNLLGRAATSKEKVKQQGHPAVRPSSAGPQRSKQSGAFPNRPRPSSAKSKVAQYMDGTSQVKRRWATSSSLWGSRSTSSTAGDIQIAGQRSKLTDAPKSPLMMRKSRPASAKNVASLSSDGEPDVRLTSHSQRSRPWSASASVRASRQNEESLKVSSAQLADSQTVRALDSYANRAIPPLTMRLIVESPRGSEGLSLWQLLPDELLLHIFSYLTQYQLVTCAQTCSMFNRVALDESLWRHIHLKKRVLTDFWLTQIGERHPTNLEIVQCTGNITENGLRNLFRSCADNLKELNVSGCSSGELSGDSLLLHASRCYNLTRLDASWCNVTDNGLTAINDSVNQLKTLCLNGCREVSDTGLRSVISKHGKSLKVLEVFGCFNLSVDTLKLIGEECKHLNTLNIGQCYKLTDESIAKLAPHLKGIMHLDLRGCKQIRDGCIRKLVRHSKKLDSLVLANCTHISNTALTEIATYLPTIKHLDLAGCKRVTNDGVKALATNCHQLTTLDISSTSIDHRSIASLASYCSKSLCGLKMNCCKDITESSIVKLLKHCRGLETVHLYGVKGLRTLGVLKLQYTCLMYEAK